jgi:hypothetical protein
MNPLIHRYWTGNLPKPEVSKFAGQIAVTQGVLKDWDDYTLPPDIKEYADSLNHLVPPEYLARHRSNVVRLELLNQFGGTWLDHDMVCFQFPDRSAAWTAFSNSGVASCAMYFDKSDAALAIAKSSIAAANTSMFASGDAMLTRVWAGRGITPHQLPYEKGAIRNVRGSFWGVHFWVSSS